jgi:hypothetical protein
MRIISTPQTHIRFDYLSPSPPAQNCPAGRSGRVGWRFLEISGFFGPFRRVCSGRVRFLQRIGGSGRVRGPVGRVGSRKMDSWTTLRQQFVVVRESILHEDCQGTTLPCLDLQNVFGLASAFLCPSLTRFRLVTQLQIRCEAYFSNGNGEMDAFGAMGLGLGLLHNAVRIGIGTLEVRQSDDQGRKNTCGMQNGRSLC